MVFFATFIFTESTFISWLKGIFCFQIVFEICNVYFLSRCDKGDRGEERKSVSMTETYLVKNVIEIHPSTS